MTGGLRDAFDSVCVFNCMSDVALDLVLVWDLV